MNIIKPVMKDGEGCRKRYIVFRNPPKVTDLIKDQIPKSKTSTNKDHQTIKTLNNDRKRKNRVDGNFLLDWISINTSSFPLPPSRVDLRKKDDLKNITRLLPEKDPRSSNDVDQDRKKKDQVNDQERKGSFISSVSRPSSSSIVKVDGVEDGRRPKRLKASQAIKRMNEIMDNFNQLDNSNKNHKIDFSSSSRSNKSNGGLNDSSTVPSSSKLNLNSTLTRPIDKTYDSSSISRDVNPMVNDTNNQTSFNHVARRSGSKGKNKRDEEEEEAVVAEEEDYNNFLEFYNNSQVQIQRNERDDGRHDQNHRCYNKDPNKFSVQNSVILNKFQKRELLDRRDPLKKHSNQTRSSQKIISLVPGSCNQNDKSFGGLPSFQKDGVSPVVENDSKKQKTKSRSSPSFENEKDGSSTRERTDVNHSIIKEKMDQDCSNSEDRNDDRTLSKDEESFLKINESTNNDTSHPIDDQTSQSFSQSLVTKFPIWFFDSKSCTPLNELKPSNRNNNNNHQDHHNHMNFSSNPELYNILFYLVDKRPLSKIELKRPFKRFNNNRKDDKKNGEGEGDYRVVSLAKFECLDYTGSNLSLTLWDDVAEELEPACHIGDLIYLSGISVSVYKGMIQANSTKLTKAQICYRFNRRNPKKTKKRNLGGDLSYVSKFERSYDIKEEEEDDDEGDEEEEENYDYDEDEEDDESFRPDLRLNYDPTTKKIQEFVSWIETFIL